MGKSLAILNSYIKIISLLAIDVFILVNFNHRGDSFEYIFVQSDTKRPQKDKGQKGHFTEKVSPEGLTQFSSRIRELENWL